MSRIATHTKPLPIRIPAEMVNRIDKSSVPHLAPREAYVRELLDKALRAEERAAERKASK